MTAGGKLKSARAPRGLDWVSLVWCLVITYSGVEIENGVEKTTGLGTCKLKKSEG
jgi:hypothetical protein